MRTSRSHVPRLVYIALNMCICVRTITHALPACDSARGSCTCCYSCAHACGPVLINLNFPQLLSMRTSRSHVPRPVYTPLNMCICARTFTHALPESDSARESCTFSFSCAHACVPVLVNLNFPPTFKHAPR